MQTFEQLTETERAWVKDQLDHASRFAGTQGREILPSLEELDKAWANFIVLGSAANDRANSVVLCVGIAFGEHLVRALGFSWCISTDEWGTDIAVLARPGRGNVTIFPTDFVSERWETAETDFLARSIEAIEDTLLDCAADWDRDNPE